MGFDGIYPLVMTNIAIENGHRNRDLPIEHMVDLSIVCESFPEGIVWC